MDAYDPAVLKQLEEFKFLSEIYATIVTIKQELDIAVDMIYEIKTETQYILDNPTPSIRDCSSAHRINILIDEALKKLEELK